MAQTAKINVTVETFRPAVVSTRPVAYCDVRFERDPSSTDDGRVSIIQWPIGAMVYWIIRVAGVNSSNKPDLGAVKITFSILDNLGNANTYLAKDFRAEQKPMNPRAGADDPNGDTNLHKVTPSGNKISIVD